MKNSVTKIYDGKKWQYTFNGKVYRNSKREFRYACLASYNSKKWVLSLGNDKVSTYNSMARFYAHCQLEVVEIEAANTLM